MQRVWARRIVIGRMLLGMALAGLVQAGCGGGGVVAQQARAPDLMPFSAPTPEMRDWMAGFRGRALAAGIDAGVFDRAMRPVGYSAFVVDKDRNQAEFTKTIWDYLDSAVSAEQIANGQAALSANRAVLEEIEATYGVDKAVVTAIWGIESKYGARRGNVHVIEALATLAFDGRRGAFFESQLIAALKIIQNGDVDVQGMTGSWAGAMGHTQFIPTSYQLFAVDFRGDGKRDIWGEDPTDALASTAAYLARSGWVKGQPWGVEVKLPAGFNLGATGKGVRRSGADWAGLGVRDVNGGVVPDHGAAAIILPAGAKGAAFLIFSNFTAISRYNAADPYVIAVGHLSDRIKGGPAIQASWPRDANALTFVERQELQRLLTARGFDTQGTDGNIGPNSVTAIRAYQVSAGMEADGFADRKLLERLR